MPPPHLAPCFRNMHPRRVQTVPPTAGGTTAAESTDVTFGLMTLGHDVDLSYLSATSNMVVWWVTSSVCVGVWVCLGLDVSVGGINEVARGLVAAISVAARHRDPDYTAEFSWGACPGWLSRLVHDVASRDAKRNAVCCGRTGRRGGPRDRSSRARVWCGCEQSESMMAPAFSSVYK